jgi:hypothetical protein
MLDADDRIASVSVRACRLPPAVPWEDATHRVGALEFIFVSASVRLWVVLEPVDDLLILQQVPIITSNVVRD